MTAPEPGAPRVVSLLPSATEIVCALGAGDLLVGRSHECDHPQDVVRALPVCTRARFDDGTSKEIDERVVGLLNESLSLYDANTVNGTLTLIGSTGLSGPSKAGLAFSASGSLRAAIGNTLYSIDSATAAPTSLGSIGTAPFTTGEVSGLVFVPEPQQRPLSVAALVTLSLLLGIRRRQRAPVEAR